MQPAISIDDFVANIKERCLGLAISSHSTLFAILCVPLDGNLLTGLDDGDAALKLPTVYVLGTGRHLLLERVQ